MAILPHSCLQAHMTKLASTTYPHLMKTQQQCTHFFLGQWERERERVWANPDSCGSDTK